MNHEEPEAYDCTHLEQIAGLLASLHGYSLAALKEHSGKCEAHPFATRPKGLPTMGDLREIGVHAYLSHDSAKRENAGCMVDPMGAAADAILTALSPWLHDTVGCELDVHPDQIELYKWVTEPDGGYAYAAQQAIDLCRSRIRPVYECKECAKKEAERDVMYRDWDDCRNRMLKVRLALNEGSES